MTRLELILQVWRRCTDHPWKRVAGAISLGLSIVIIAWCIALSKGFLQDEQVDVFETIPDIQMEYGDNTEGGK